MKGSPSLPSYKPGQVLYRMSAFSPEKMLVTIMAIEDGIVHVHVGGLAVRTPAGQTLTQMFLPMDHAALAKSELVRQSDHSTDFEALQHDWLAAHDTRGQGCFTVPLDELFAGLTDAQPSEESL